MTDSTCNGWTNYETWRVGLELIDDYASSMLGDQTFSSVSELAEAFKSYVDDVLSGELGGPTEGVAVDYARAFVSDVNWYELAEAHADDLVRDWDAITEAASKLGGQRGHNAACWVDVDASNARQILDSFEDCDYEIPAPLSGEWADSADLRMVCDELGIREDEDGVGDVLDAYEQAYSEAYETEVTRAARHHLAD